LYRFYDSSFRSHFWLTSLRCPDRRRSRSFMRALCN
jgi:hypothetical protein